MEVCTRGSIFHQTTSEVKEIRKPSWDVNLGYPGSVRTDGAQTVRGQPSATLFTDGDSDGHIKATRTQPLLHAIPRQSQSHQAVCQPAVQRESGGGEGRL